MKENRASIKIFKAALLMFVSVIFLMFNSLTVNAVDSSADQGGGGAHKDSTGESTLDSSRSGWLIYIVDRAGQMKSPDAVVWWSHGEPDLNINCNKIKTRLGEIPESEQLVNFPYGQPLINGYGQGGNVRNKLIQPNDNGVERWEELIMDIWHDEKLVQEMIDNDYVLLLEPVYYYNVFYNGQKTSTVIAGTANTIAKYQNDQGGSLVPNGDSQLRLYTNQNFPLSGMFQADKTVLGLTVPTQRSGKISNDSIIEKAYGIIAIWPVNDCIHTWDSVTYPDGTPGPSPSEPKGIHVNISKSYYTENISTGEVTNDGSFVKTDVSPNIIIDSEPLYSVVSWHISTSEASEIPGQRKEAWDSAVPGTHIESGEGPGSVVVKDPGVTLYVLLKRIESEPEEEMPKGIDYIIRESQITKSVWLSEAETNKDAATIKKYVFNWQLPEFKCPGHNHVQCKWNDGYSYDADGDGEKESYRPGWWDSSTEYCAKWTLTDTDLKFVLKDEYIPNFPNVRSDSENEIWNKLPMIGEQKEQEYTRTKLELQQTKEDGEKFQGYDMHYVIHRGQDKLTLANWINERHGRAAEASSLLKNGGVYSLGYSSGNTPADHRMNEGAENQDYSDMFEVHIVDASEELGDNVTKAKPGEKTHGGEWCGEKEVFAKLDPMKVISPINVFIETYSGMPKGSGLSDNYVIDARSPKAGSIASAKEGYENSFGVEVPTGTSIGFYPYIEMRYDTTESKDDAVYVVGQYMRSIIPNDYAEILWNHGNVGNLTLDSKQWSTHASAVSGSQWKKKDSVLPGGATMNLQIKSGDRQTMMVRTYQTILPVGSWGREQVENAHELAEGLLTEESAKGYHEGFVQSIYEGLDNLCVEQWASKNWDIEPFNGQVVTPGVSLGSGAGAVGGGGKASPSEETKYYFRMPEGTAQDGDLDVKDDYTTTSKIYLFYADTAGNIHMTEGTDPVGGTVIVPHGSNTVSLSGVAQEINDRTHIVDKLVVALERNTGNDSEALNVGDGRWYNEAFDGIAVIKQSTVLTTGFADPATRVAVLDVKLAKPNKGQADLFSSAIASQFKMQDHVSGRDEKEVLGYFTNGGVAGVEVKMPGMEKFYISKKFYIPNVNVQDTRG